VIYKKEIEFNVEVFDSSGKNIQCDVELEYNESIEIILPFEHDEEREFLMCRMIHHMGKKSVQELASIMNEKDRDTLNSFVDCVDWDNLQLANHDNGLE